MTLWLATPEFAARYGLSRQRAAKLLGEFAAGRLKPWKGAVLHVREAKAKGGCGGKTYEVDAASLPHVADADGDASEANLPAVVPAAPPPPNGQMDEWQWRVEVIRPALEAQSKEQHHAAICAIAATPHNDWRGKRRSVSKRTAYRWIKSYIEGGLGELTRQQRGDKGNARVIVSRAYDRITRFPDATLNVVKAKLDAFIKGYVVHNKVQTLRRRVIVFEVERNLKEWTRELLGNVIIPEAQLSAACKCQPSWIEAQRHLRKAGFLIHNNKEFRDDLPRIRRSLPQRPMQRVVFDVRKVNVRVAGVGRSAKVKTAYEIGFIDVATGRHLSMHVFLENGGAVRNVDMTEAVAYMFSHPEWGVPETIQYDNGKENNFAEFLKPILNLLNHSLWPKRAKQPVVQAASGVKAEFSQYQRTNFKALPYNASAKEIERSYRAVNELETPLDGYIDDDRMKALQSAPGKLVAPHSDPDSYFLRMEERDAYFNNLPRGGRYGGESPNARYQRLCAETGHVPTVMDPDELRACCTDAEVREVKQHRVQVKGRSWSCKQLQKSFDEWITVHVPRYHGFNKLFAQLPTGEHLILTSDEEFEFDDTRGAIRSAAQKRLTEQAARQHIRENPQPKPFGGVVDLTPAAPLPPNVHVLKSHRPKDPELAIVPGEPKKRRANGGRIDPLEVLQLRRKGKGDV